MKSKTVTDLDQLADLIALEKKKGHTIALANGGFDLFHAGHVRYLEAAKEVADILVVAVNSDRSLKQLKGVHRGLIDERGRQQIIAALRCVDYVILIDDLRMDHVIRCIRPDFHCKGSDYTPETVPEYATACEVGTQVCIVGGPKIRSSSQVLAQIAEKPPHV